MSGDSSEFEPMPTPQEAPWSSHSARRGASWLAAGGGADVDVVVSSRVRLARNLRAFPFLTRADDAQRRAIIEAIRLRISACALAPSVMWVPIERLPQLERMLLVERHLMSKELAKGDSPTAPRALAVSLPDEQLSIMVNEEDHIRLQVLRPGLALAEAWQAASAADDLLEAGLEFAFHSRFGYLTACPTNVGTGVRMSVMLHLPALRLTGEIDKVKRAATDMGMSVRGFYGEGSEATGDFFQLSNQRTLGRPEQHILRELASEIIPKVIEYERAARTALATRRTRYLEDTLHRALGLLRTARLLTPQEAMNNLSLVRLGTLLGTFKAEAPTLEAHAVTQLLVQVQQCHIQKLAERQMDQQQRREFRADLVRMRLA
ncbi:MAG: ATP--guanido phosphotransferase [Phycisphaerales bacterium]|jgi:protein arginine kinase|nr:ATP--guanido phosphotransferase [Phycisphaerales bacterium]